MVSMTAARPTIVMAQMTSIGENDDESGSADSHVCAHRCASRHEDVSKPHAKLPRTRSFGQLGLASIGNGTGRMDVNTILTALEKFFVGRFQMILHAFDNIPDTYKFNPYIRHGYRIHIRKRDCLRSILRWHNETLNIHTHLIGSLMFIGLMFTSWQELKSEHWMHFVMFLLYLLSALQCLVSSTLYHIFGCHSECTFERLLSLDYSGISALIFGSQVPVVFYLFRDDPLWMGVHMTALLGVTIGAHAVTHSPKYQSEDMKSVRVVAFALNAFYAILPYIQCSLMQGFDDGLRTGLMYVGLMYLAYGSGVAIYVAQIPERWFPGKFDYVMQSHQMWHCLVITAAMSQYYAILSLYQRSRQLELSATVVSLA